MTSRIDALLARARARLRRLDPEEVAAAVRRGAVLVDIRPAAQRAFEGQLPGALVIERNVLEWRCDPTSAARLPQADGDDVAWVLLCSQGYTSSLAAAALQDLGLFRATDIAGGYQGLLGSGVLSEVCAALATGASPAGGSPTGGSPGSPVRAASPSSPESILVAAGQRPTR